MDDRKSRTVWPPCCEKRALARFIRVPTMVLAAASVTPVPMGVVALLGFDVLHPAQRVLPSDGV